MYPPESGDLGLKTKKATLVQVLVFQQFATKI